MFNLLYEHINDFLKFSNLFFQTWLKVSKYIYNLIKRIVFYFYTKRVIRLSSWYSGIFRSTLGLIKSMVGLVSGLCILFLYYPYILNSINGLLFLNLSIFPYFLVINCFFIFMFKKWIGPKGVFYSSIFFFILTSYLSFIFLKLGLCSGDIFYVDMGRWFYALDIIDSNMVMCFDNLALLLISLILLLTSLAHFFGVEYMFREAFITRLIYLLNMFSTSVILLFIVYDFFLILIVWELIGLFSFLLVNFYSQRIYTIKAALKTFIFSRISDMFIFLSFTLVILVLNTSDLTIIFLKTPFFIYYNIYIFGFSVNFITLTAFLIAIASSIKGSQFFFHVWLPDAMEAPTPASALIHSSTLVIMGIYVIIRFSVLYEFSGIVNYFLIIIGSVTISFGSLTACFQSDIKKLVAYSTISQMGYLITGCGFVTYEEVIIYLIMHAMNKSFLFILVGYIVHFYNHNTDLRQISNLFSFSFDIVVYLIGVNLNLMGFPFSAGYSAKEYFLYQTIQSGFSAYMARANMFLSFCATPLYSFLLSTVVGFGPTKTVLSHQSRIFEIGTLVNLSLNGKFTLNRYRVSNVTSQLTTLILFLFLIFYFNYGESWVLMIFNFMSTTSTITSGSFNYIKFFHELGISLNSTSLISTIFNLIVLALVITSILLSWGSANTVLKTILFFFNDFTLILITLMLLL